MKQIQLISKFKARSYQESIFANCINKNSLVILPTGLGKTVIAIMLAMYYFNKTGKKVLFLAPTKPLVEQQEKSFQSFFKNSEEFKFQTLTGLVSPKKRVALYEESNFIFSTPQLIENDLVNRILNPKDFCFVIFDEAHRGTGNYAYTFIAEQFAKAHSNILALTASPGTSKDEIRVVLDNLKLQHFEVKRYEDYDVKPYVHQTKIDTVKIELDDNLKSINDDLHKAYSERLKKLKEWGFFEKKPISQITKKDLLDLQRYLRVEISQGEPSQTTWDAISLSAGLMKLQYGIELFESQEISAAHSYFYNFFRPGGDKSKAAEELSRDISFRDAFDKISQLKKDNVKHPKLLKLVDTVNKEINEDKNLKIIIFNQYRDTAVKIVSELNKIREIKSALFVGQAKKGDVKMSQKEQKEIISKFREGEYNVLVSTSVGEEGLDIPKVDLVIFYEPVPSAIRTIQRVGRTGRFKKGKAYILVTQGTRDVVTRHIANAKERKMYRVLDELKKEFSKKKEDNGGLSKFLKPKEEKVVKEESVKIDGVDERIPIYVDNRENNDLIKELFNSEHLLVEAKQLDVGDIVISEQIAIERKAKADFVNSIIDKRLFPQLLDLAKNYRRPILILEGEESLFAIRNMSPNVIRATLSAIAIDLRIPIIYTNSMSETKSMVEVIAKRAYRPKKEISLADVKTSFSEDQELEKFVSSIPKVNVMTAKLLLDSFGSVEKMVKAKKEDFLKIEGIGKIRAEFLFDFFRREWKKS